MTSRQDLIDTAARRLAIDCRHLDITERAALDVLSCGYVAEIARRVGYGSDATTIRQEKRLVADVVRAAAPIRHRAIAFG